jgi:motility quorum-sensing regulator/GCU-specific mRNA interferase toxin
MEKKVPHTRLSIVKTMVGEGKVRFAGSAISGGAALGFDADGIVGVLMSLTSKQFYKSMTTHADHRVWQDVYRATTSAGEVYLKLTVCDDVLVVSFKEL